MGISLYKSTVILKRIMPRQVLNYHDVQLYDSDVALFTAPGAWLNDNAINFYFQYLSQSLCVAQGRESELLLMDPAVVSCMMLQCDDDDEYAELGRGLQVHSRKICFLPVNDNQEFGGDCSHWSLLVYHCAARSFEHYDSSAGHNTQAAQHVSETFQTLLKASSAMDPTGRASFQNVRGCPQQRNGYDCGMYVLRLAEYLCKQYLQQPALPSMADYVTPQQVTQMRHTMPELIQKLISESQ